MIDQQGTSQVDWARLTPEQMLARFVAGDDEAFSRFVDCLGGRLYGFICRFLADRVLGEDVYQTVLMRIATNASSYDGRARVQTWVYRIARNLCVYVVRQNARGKTVSLDGVNADEGGLLEVQPSNTLRPDEKLSLEELGVRIAQAVEALPEDQREVFLLREDADLTFEEIGTILGCGRETAKSRMRYAIRRLQSMLGTEARAYGLVAVHEEVSE